MTLGIGNKLDLGFQATVPVSLNSKTICEFPQHFPQIINHPSGEIKERAVTHQIASLPIHLILALSLSQIPLLLNLWPSIHVKWFSLQKHLIFISVRLVHLSALSIVGQSMWLTGRPGASLHLILQVSNNIWQNSQLNPNSAFSSESIWFATEMLEILLLV